MFEFIKKIFVKKDRDSHQDDVEDFTQDLGIERLGSWIKDNEKELLDKSKVKVKPLIDDIKEKMDRLKEAVDTLDKAEAEDDKVMGKVKNVVRGHKENYIRNIRNNLLSVDVPDKVFDEGSYEGILNFYESLKEGIDVLGKTSGKSHYTTQHLFSEHVNGIVNIIKEVDEDCRLLGDYIENLKISDIKNVYEHYESLNDLDLQTKSLEKEISELKEQLAEFEGKRDDSVLRKENITKSQGYGELKGLQKKLKDAEDGIMRSKREIVELFSPISSVLNKYSRIAFDNHKLIEGYCDNPVTMLLSDKQLEIYDVLSKMKHDIEMSNLDVNEKKKDKIIEKIDNINKEKLSKIVGQYTVYVNIKNECIEKLSKSSLISERRKLDKDIDLFIKKIEDVKDSIKALEDKVSQIDIQKACEKLSESVEQVFKKKINIEI